MQTTICAIFVGLATLTSAQSGIQDLPDCARTCVTQFTTGSSIGTCNNSDVVCICSSASFLSDIACCLVGKCDTADQQKATDFAHQFCALAGVTNLPASVTCTSTSASTPASTSPSSATSTGSPSSTSSPSSTPSASSAVASAATSAATSTATPNSASRNGVRVGAGIICAGIAALV